ncbi:MAG: AtzE family amidohydrolase [Candidatus Rokubacteria bacterium]|nr:AtzE family amidohydrolase [Candidatus Rokubacteria bacterium]
MDATAIAQAVRARTTTARAVVEQALAWIAARDRAVNAFTRVLADEALAAAERVDAGIAAGRDPGPLAGVPFAVKNLFDVAGVVTLAGSKIHADRPPAARDATAVAALRRAGAVLVGAVNMDEYAYGFTTENTHYGPTRNPHDLTRVAGGSSGGSAAAVAAGMVALALGTDTNGSIRVPAALCGVFGLKPTYGRVSRAGVVLFASSFDHVGPLARSTRDLAAAFDALQGADPSDPACTRRPVELAAPELDRGAAGLRLAIADGHFAKGGAPECHEAVTRVADALGVTRRVTLPEAHRARAAAFVITTSEGAQQHLESLRTRANDFDPLIRDRFLAGALVPAVLYTRAHRFRAWFRDRVREVFRDVDVLLAPTTPWPAPAIGQDTSVFDGAEVLTRPMLGIFTQPLSFIGLPVVSVPIPRPGALPVGVQVIAAPWNERAALRVAAVLERTGLAAAPAAEESPGLTSALPR